jgi:hypothetical protein
VKRGSALPVALYALALISALVVGTSFVTRRLASSARLSERGAILAPEAEELVAAAVAGWDSSARSAQAIGSTQTAGRTSGGEGGQAWVTRLSPSIYWVVGLAESRQPPGLRRRLGLLVTTQSGTPALVSGRAWGDLP